MGEMADDILDGIFCQVCGSVMEDVDESSEALGYPRTCQTCLDEEAVAIDMEERFFKSRHGNRRPKKKRRGVNDNETG